MRIMFMGTPEIAAISLERLIDEKRDVVAVVTREDKPRGRGKILTPTPVKELALRHSIPVFTPVSLKTDEFLAILHEYQPDIIVVVAYGKILPRSVLDYPRYGCINLHVSLLPKYRGAAPMQRAIMNGESVTGVTIMYMAEGLDTGDIIDVEKFPIDENDDFESIHDKSAYIGSRLLSKTIDSIEAGSAARTPQNSDEASYAAKIEKSDCHIDLSLPASRLHAIIRGLTPIPGAFVYQGGKMLKIYNVYPTDGEGQPGEVVAIDAKGTGSFTIATGEGCLTVRGVIPEGKGKMSAGDYIRGRKINIGEILE